MKRLVAGLCAKFVGAAKLGQAVKANMENLGYGR